MVKIQAFKKKVERRMWNEDTPKSILMFICIFLTSFLFSPSTVKAQVSVEAVIDSIQAGQWFRVATNGLYDDLV